MPNVDEYPESELIKMIYLGDSGAGKTGSLMSLAAAGYNVRVLDLDKGAQILRSYATDPKSIYLQPKAGLWTEAQAKSVASRINYKTISETYTQIKNSLVPKGDSWEAILNQLTEWKDGERNLGKLDHWTTNDVLVIDSFSRFCDARMSLELVLNGRAMQGRQQGDYFKVQSAIESALELLVSKAVHCHVIMICHISYEEQDDGSIKGVPQSMGKALGPKIGQHFNHSLLAKATGQGTMEKRKILTKTMGMIGLKTSAPLSVKPEYDLETGLAEYFRAVLGAGPTEPKLPPVPQPIVVAPPK